MHDLRLKTYSMDI